MQIYGPCNQCAATNQYRPITHRARIICFVFGGAISTDVFAQVACATPHLVGRSRAARQPLRPARLERAQLSGRRTDPARAFACVLLHTQPHQVADGWPPAVCGPLPHPAGHRHNSSVSSVTLPSASRRQTMSLRDEAPTVYSVGHWREGNFPAPPSARLLQTSRSGSFRLVGAKSSRLRYRPNRSGEGNLVRCLAGRISLMMCEL